MSHRGRRKTVCFAPPRPRGRAAVAYAVLSVLPLLLSLASRAHALPPTVSQGTFVDPAGGRHAWTINSSHVLLWDNKPFLPVGGLFQVQSWSRDATAADFAADRTALAAIKARGVTDVLLQPAQGGITGVPPAALQRTLDYLEAEGFTYGISLADGPREPLAAYEVRPGAYRQTTASGGTTALRFPAENLASSLYFVVTPTGSDIIARGQAQMIPEGARVETPAVSGQMITFLVPEKLYFVGSPMGIPNLWDGYDGYRDAVLTLFGQVRLGKGFRFFVDALPASLNLSDEALRLIPDSPGFMTEWGAYLTRKYRTLETLDVAWSITNRDVPSFEAAAGLLPLWNGGKGVSLFYDRYSRREVKTDFTRATFWSDLRGFMTDSVRGYMNDLAVALKHGVADVPVVYRSQGASLLFSRLPPGGQGFDGIGINAYGRGRDLIAAGGAGEVYAQASEAGRTLWLPVTATSDAGPAPDSKAAPGYASRAALFGDFDWLRDIGARGFYVDSLRTLDPGRAKFSIGDLPAQLTWLSDYQSRLTASVRSGGPLDTLPGVTYFPRGLNGASVRLLANGEWWLPTDRPVSLYDFGTAGSTYALTESDGASTYYLWNPSGKTRLIHLKLPPQTKLKDAPKVQWSASANGTVKGDTLALTIGPEPIRLLNYPTIPLPVEAFEEAFQEAQRLTAEMKKRNALEMGLYTINLPQMRMQYEKRGDPWFGYGMLREALLKMRTVLRDYAWLQAEGDETQAPTNQSFDAIEERVGAGGGRVLVVGKRAGGMPRASAQYTITVNKPGTFALWVAASPGAPLTFLLDGKSVIDEGSLLPRTPGGTGAVYANGALAWINFGPITLPQGIHTLEMRASGPALVDTLLLTRNEFVPDGPNPPPVLAP